MTSRFLEITPTKATAFSDTTDDEKQQAFKHWLNSEPRPPIIHQNAQKFPPWKRFKIRCDDGSEPFFSGHVIAYAEDGTVRCTVESPFLTRHVFGVNTNDLIEV